MVAINWPAARMRLLRGRYRRARGHRSAPDWTLWQHSETGTVSGVTGAVDLDRFQADRLALQMFIEQSVLP